MPRYEQFRLPDAGEGLTEADIVEWRVAVGDRVVVNQVIVEIETAKSLVELPSPFAGVVTELLAEPGHDRRRRDADHHGRHRPGRGAAARRRRRGSAGADVAGDGSAASDAGSGAVLVGYGTAEGVSRRARRAVVGAAAVAPTGAVRPRAGVGRQPGRDGHRPSAIRSRARVGAARGVGPRRRRVGQRAARAPGRAEARGVQPVLAKPPVRKLAKDLGVDLATVSPTGPGRHRDPRGRGRPLEAATSRGPWPPTRPTTSRGWPRARWPRTAARPGCRSGPCASAPPRRWSRARSARRTSRCSTPSTSPRRCAWWRSLREDRQFADDPRDAAADHREGAAPRGPPAPRGQRLVGRRVPGDRLQALRQPRHRRPDAARPHRAERQGRAPARPARPGARARRPHRQGAGRHDDARRRCPTARSRSRTSASSGSTPAPRSSTRGSPRSWRSGRSASSRGCTRARSASAT